MIAVGEEIPTERKIFSESKEHVIVFGKLNYGEPFTDINCHNLGIDLCERCAGKIEFRDV